MHPAQWTPVDEQLYEVLVASSTTSHRYYVGYILCFAIIDMLALLRLIPEIPAAVHVALTLVLALGAVVAICLSVAHSSRAAAKEHRLLLHLLRAHNERAADNLPQRASGAGLL